MHIRICFTAKNGFQIIVIWVREWFLFCFWFPLAVDMNVSALKLLISSSNGIDIVNWTNVHASFTRQQISNTKCTSTFTAVLLSLSLCVCLKTKRSKMKWNIAAHSFAYFFYCDLPMNLIPNRLMSPLCYQVLTRRRWKSVSNAAICCISIHFSLSAAVTQMTSVAIASPSINGKCVDIIVRLCDNNNV